MKLIIICKAGLHPTRLTLPPTAQIKSKGVQEALDNWHGSDHPHTTLSMRAGGSRTSRDVKQVKQAMQRKLTGGGVSVKMFADTKDGLNSPSTGHAAKQYGEMPEIRGIKITKSVRKFCVVMSKSMNPNEWKMNQEVLDANGEASIGDLGHHDFGHHFILSNGKLVGHHNKDEFGPTHDDILENPNMWENAKTPGKFHWKNHISPEDKSAIDNGKRRESKVFAQHANALILHTHPSDNSMMVSGHNPMTDSQRKTLKDISIIHPHLKHEYIPMGVKDLSKVPKESADGEKELGYHSTISAYHNTLRKQNKSIE
jgi:hypothetical protein